MLPLYLVDHVECCGIESQLWIWLNFCYQNKMLNIFEMSKLNKTSHHRFWSVVSLYANKLMLTTVYANRPFHFHIPFDPLSFTKIHFRVNMATVFSNCTPSTLKPEIKQCHWQNTWSGNHLGHCQVTDSEKWTIYDLHKTWE